MYVVKYFQQRQHSELNLGLTNALQKANKEKSLTESHSHQKWRQQNINLQCYLFTKIWPPLSLDPTTGCSKFTKNITSQSICRVKIKTIKRGEELGERCDCNIHSRRSFKTQRIPHLPCVHLKTRRDLCGKLYSQLPFYKINTSSQ